MPPQAELCFCPQACHTCHPHFCHLLCPLSPKSWCSSHPPCSCSSPRLRKQRGGFVISGTLSPSCQAPLAAPVLLLQHVLTDATFLLPWAPGEAQAGWNSWKAGNCSVRDKKKRLHGSSEGDNAPTEALGLHIPFPAPHSRFPSHSH